MNVLKLSKALLLSGMIATVSLLPGLTQAQSAKKLRIQSAFPPSSLIYENGEYWAERVNKMSGGRLAVEILPPGAVVPPFEILDAVGNGVIEGGHTAPAYWVGKNKAATLFGPAPGGPFGMDLMDYMGWIYEGDGLALYADFFQNTLKANVVPFPMSSVAQQPLGWFKNEVKNWEDLKGRKCRHTGVTAEVFGKAGVAPVNVPGGEIIPAGERGVIECAEFTGPADDMKIGFQTIWKHFYAQSMQEPATVLEVLINKKTWDGLPEDLQEIIEVATIEATLRSEIRRNRLNALALDELSDKYGVTIHNTPDDILTKTLEAWDDIAAKEYESNATFKKIYDSLREYAEKVVPSRVINSAPYEVGAQYYWADKLK